MIQYAFKITNEDDGELFYDLKFAKYNLRKLNHGYEFTLSVESASDSTIYGVPLFEVTVFSKDEIQIMKGAKWVEQVAYSDDPNLGFLSLLYVDRHDNLDDFTVEVLDVLESKLLCRVSGVAGEYHYLDFVGEFELDTQLVRAAER